MLLKILFTEDLIDGYCKIRMSCVINYRPNGSRGVCTSFRCFAWFVGSNICASLMQITLGDDSPVYLAISDGFPNETCSKLVRWNKRHISL